MAVSPWAQLEQQANATQAPPPPGVFAPVSMPGAPPDMPASAAPQVARIPTPIEDNIANDQQQLQKVRWQQANPWGTPENHPGTLGKVAHVFSNIGNIAGDIFAPDVMAHIPGTQMNREVKEGQLTNRLNQENTENEQNLQREAMTAKTNEETAEAPGKAQSEESLQGEQGKNLASETTARDQTAAQGPSLASAYAHAVNQALKENRDPAQDPVVQHLQDAITGLQKSAAPKGAHFIQRQVGGKPHTIAVDDLTGVDIRDEGETGEKPPTVNVNAGLGALDRETARFAKPYEKGVADANTQLDKIADARSLINGSAEDQALGVPKVLTAIVSGPGSGVRITQPELNAIAKARGIIGDVQGFLNSISGQGQLTATQQHQLTGLLDSVKDRITQKAAIHSQALDAINGAPTRDAAIAADKDARQKLANVEKGSGSATAPQGADNEVYVSGKLVGHTVQGKYVPLAK